MKDLGRLLKELRGNKSLREVAEVTELSHTYISDIEKGYRRGTKKPIHPSPDTLKRLADAYDYPYEELMKIAGYLTTDDEEFQAFSNDPNLNHFFRDIEASSEQEQEELKQIFEIIKKRRKE